MNAVKVGESAEGTPEEHLTDQMSSNAALLNDILTICYDLNLNRRSICMLVSQSKVRGSYT